MCRIRWVGLLPALVLAWAVLPPPTFFQTSGTTGWAIRIIGMVQRMQSEPNPFTVTLEVKNQKILLVRDQVLSDEEQNPLSYIVADIVGHRLGIEVRDPEELREALLREEPGQRVLEFRGMYEPASRVFYLSDLHPLETYPPRPGCPPLPTEGPANKVSVYVAKALDKPGLVCVRMFNGLSEMISYGLPLGRLQQWEEGTWWRKGKFRDFQDVSTLPDGSRVMVPLVRLFLPAGERRDGNLPYSDLPAPPGRYRVCFDYSVARQGARSEYEVCSEEFSLP